MKTNVLLKNYTTFKIGGPAKYFKQVDTIEEMQETLHFANKKKIPFHILGRGSNSLFDDKGYNGLVILNKINTYTQDSNRFTVGAGFSFAYLGVKSARKGYGGLEFASGIPASVGGAIFMNAGANGKETRDHLEEVLFVTKEGKLISYKKQDLEFSYRSSSFQKMEGAIVSAIFSLQEMTNAREHQLEIVNYRRVTQPYNEPSIGCIFRNPQNGSAGQLIEESQLKGESVGGALISSIHANFIVNSANAKSEDVKQLIKLIQTKIKCDRGIDLESEIRIIPYV
ncbi:UDP-N-acetylmuramate dehydrogenase [Chlamydiales bacterium]|nr:UDP-N-acetylmuramate dehydrogenase [Chlamydiales bacterium]